MEIRELIISGLIKVSFRFERFFPQFIKLFLNRKLEEYREKGVLTDYKVKTKRRGKYHYSLEVDLYVNVKKGGETRE